MKKDILLFILIFIAILSTILIKPVNNLDELWNYNFAKNFANGLVTYKDFNMLQMPLLPLVCGVILKIICNELIIMRILASILCTFIIFMIYKIFNELNIKKEIGIIFTLIIAMIFKNYYCIDYNFATLFIVLLLIYYEIKEYKKDNLLFKANKKTDIMLGILAGLTLTLKQTSGLLICIALLGNKLLFLNSKDRIKIYFKSLFYRLIGILIPLLLMLVYLFVNNAFSEFISYTIKGVSGFSNYISYKNLIRFNIIGILAILIPITYIYAWYESIIKEKDKNTFFLLIYGMAMFVIAFPISDNIHFLIGSIPILILIFYKIYCFLKKIKYKNILFFSMKFCLFFIISIISIYAIANLWYYIENKQNYSKLEHFKYIPITKELEESIEKVDDYICNTKKDVKILDATAAIYMIPINKYNKNYDMLLKGNLGQNGEEELIKDISNTKNRQYLVLKDRYNKNWQTPLNVINFTKGNKQKVGEIEIFDIYK